MAAENDAAAADLNVDNWFLRRIAVPPGVAGLEIQREGQTAALTNRPRSYTIRKLSAHLNFPFWLPTDASITTLETTYNRFLHLVNGLTSDQIAELEMLGVSRARVSDWRAGRRLPTRPQALHLSNVTGCNYAKLEHELAHLEAYKPLV